MAFITLTLPDQQGLTQSGINLAQPTKLRAEKWIASKIKVDPVTFFDQGTELYNQKNYKEAITAFNKVLKLSPDFVEAYLNRGATFLALGYFEEALKDFEEALELKPDYAHAWSNKGAVFEQQGKYEEALSAFDEAIKYQPKNPEFWYGRGYSLLNLERFVDSIAAIERSIQFQDHNYDAWLNLGTAKASLEDYSNAIYTFDKAIAIEPNRPDAWFAKGLLLLYLKRYDDALSAYTQTIVIKPEFSAAWYNRACAHGLQGDADQTIQDLSTAVDLYPDWQESAKTDPDFDLVRDNSEFQRLVYDKQNQSSEYHKSIETSEFKNPWMKFSGMYANDPLFDDVLTEIEVYRRNTSLGVLGLSNSEEFVQEMRIAAAIKWYEIGEVSQGKAAEISGLNRAEFISALTRYKVSPFQYTAKELIEELADAD